MRSRLITSPSPRSGKSSLAMNLAQSLASTGRKVLLMDADNEGQGITRSFEMVGHPGLKELLEGVCAPEQALYPRDMEGLRVLPAGQRDVTFGDALTGRRAQETVLSLFQNFEEVIVDSPPVLGRSTAVVLATLVDEVVLVLRAGESTREDVQAARQYLATVGAKNVSVILNAVDSKSLRYARYSHSYSGIGDSKET